MSSSFFVIQRKLVTLITIQTSHTSFDEQPEGRGPGIGFHTPW